MVGLVAVSAIVLAACGRNDGIVTVNVTTTLVPSSSLAAEAVSVDTNPPDVTSSSEPASTGTPTTRIVEITAPTREAVRLGFVGDTSFTNGLDQRDPFAGLDGLLAEPDLMFVNLETAVADEGVGRAFPKAFVFRSPPASLRLLVDAGVDVALLGNNHVLDYGPAAVDQTLRELDAAGLLRVGAGRDAEEAAQPLVVDVGGWSIGVVSASRVPCDWSASGENSRPEVNWACPTLVGPVEASIVDLAGTVDLVVVATHGGPEGELCAGSMMLDLAARWAELGADLIVNGHPHVLQGVRTVGDALLIESTGNFAFPSARGLSANSAVFEVELSEAGLRLRVIPVRVPGGEVSVASSEVAADILDQVEQHSTGWVFDDDGVAVADPDHEGRC